MSTYSPYRLCLAVILVSVALLTVPAAASQDGLAGKFDQSLRKGESRETLDPGNFSNPYVKQAYQVAREIPWVLDSIYCYCYCEESPAFRHKSLLSCYVDNHASV